MESVAEIFVRERLSVSQQELQAAFDPLRCGTLD
jgi:hypothetical protein